MVFDSKRQTKKEKSFESCCRSRNLVVFVVDRVPESHELLDLCLVLCHRADNDFSSLGERQAHLQVVETEHGHSDVPSQNVKVLIDKLLFNFTLFYCTLLASSR